MKSIVTILLFSILFAACQQSRLINIRNLTLVEGETEMMDEVTENDCEIAREINRPATFDRPQTTIKNSPIAELSIHQPESEEVNLSTSEKDFTEGINEIPSKIIIPNLIDNPPILSDSTKAESEKPSKKVSGKILWVFGGLSVLALILFAAVIAFGLFLVILFLWIVFGNLF